ncbi:hypothetical protein NUACC26_085510 [Scytonema sp. NUACC26]
MNEYNEYKHKVNGIVLISDLMGKVTKHVLTLHPNIEEFYWRYVNDKYCCRITFTWFMYGQRYNFSYKISNHVLEQLPLEINNIVLNFIREIEVYL